MLINSLLDVGFPHYTHITHVYSSNTLSVRHVAEREVLCMNTFTVIK